MKSYDYGCTYGGGADSSSVLVDAGLSFASQSMRNWRKSKTNENWLSIHFIYLLFFLSYRGASLTQTDTVASITRQIHKIDVKTNLSLSCLGSLIPSVINLFVDVKSWGSPEDKFCVRGIVHHEQTTSPSQGHVETPTTQHFRPHLQFGVTSWPNMHVYFLIRNYNMLIKCTHV